MSAFITILTTEPKKEVRFTDKNQFDRMREARRHGDALMPVMNYCIRREDRFHALDCHWHSEMELFRVMQGTLTVQCGTDLFEAHARKPRHTTISTIKIPQIIFTLYFTF